jgi:hypothetical protein
VLRENARGRGVSVPGLWEVEIESAADVRDVVQSVRRRCQPDPAAHTVFSLQVVRQAMPVHTAHGLLPAGSLLWFFCYYGSTSR